MIKLVYCIHRKPGLSVEAFQKYWLETHAAFGKNISGVKRYVQVHALGGELQEMLAAGHPAAKGEHFDGVAELWFEEEDLRALAGDATALAAMQDEANFIDFDRSIVFLAKEHVIVDG